jgi:hypothetical protein
MHYYTSFKHKYMEYIVKCVLISTKTRAKSLKKKKFQKIKSKIVNGEKGV